MERSKKILEDAQVELLMTDSRRVVDWSLQFDQGLCLLDGELEPQSENPTIDPQAEDLAYVIYTSGSTGRPKGVELSQRNISHYIQWANAFYFQKEKGYPMPLFTSVAFDLTLTSIFSTLTRGDALYIFEENTAVDQLLYQVFDPAAKSGGQIDAFSFANAAFLNMESTAVTKVIAGGEA